MTMLEKTARTDRRDPATVRVAVVAAVLGLVAGLAVGVYATSRGDDSTPQQRVGRGYVGRDQASLWVEKGKVSAVTTDTPWIDAQGEFREDGWPSCLPFETEVNDIHWADVLVTMPDGSAVRQIVYVDCR